MIACTSPCFYKKRVVLRVTEFIPLI